MMTTKRRIERKLEALEESATSEKERLEIHLGSGHMYEPEPDLTDALRSRGFVVEREERVHGNGNEDVILHTTPSAPDVFNAVCWHHNGPTTVPDDVRIVWEDEEHLEQILADATYLTGYAEPTVPENRIVDEGDG